MATPTLTGKIRWIHLAKHARKTRKQGCLDFEAKPNCYLKPTKTTPVIFLSSVSPSVRGILRLTLRLKNNPWQQCKTSRILQENHRLGNNAWKSIHMRWRHASPLSMTYVKKISTCYFPFLVSVLLHHFKFLSNCIAAPWLSVTVDFQWIKHIVKNLHFY